MATAPVCEYVDAFADRLDLAIHLRGEDLPEGTRFEVRLRRRGGPIASRALGEVVPRVSTVGVWTRAALHVSLPMPPEDGAFRLELVAVPEGAPGPAPDAGPATVVGPTPGLLASSRPVELGERRLQVLPAAGSPAVWFRIAGTSRVARAAWVLRDWVRDLAFAAHGRRFSWVRLARLLTRPFVPRGPIWLVGERPETARDNGRALFAHLRKARPEASIFYVIAADSPMRAAVEPLGNVVHHSSWRHRVLMLHADVLANAYSVKHMLPSRWRPGAYMLQATWRLGARRVYLKHGVHMSPEAVKRANGGYDLLAAVGPLEAQALREHSGYSLEVVETGLARYDQLVPEHQGRTVLFMPTWRRYLAPKLFGGAGEAEMPYEGSDYQRFVEGLLGSEQLAEVLERRDLRLLVVPHYNLAAELGSFRPGSPRIEMLDARTADIPALLRSCDLLVTDWSSVHFDVAYVGAPVVYAQFDREQFAAGHGAGSWFDARTDGFGPVVEDVESVVGEIDRYAGRAFEREPEFADRVSRIFAFRDRGSCERLTEAIDAVTAPSLTPSRP